MYESKQIPVSLDRIRSLFPDGEWHGMSADNFIGVADDSRKVVKGGIFVAIAGFDTDGHLYLDNACRAGAALIVVSRKIFNELKHTSCGIESSPRLEIDDTRKAASILAAEFYANPTKEIAIHGITGTKGKTTTVHLVGEILYSAGKKPAMMGTLGVEFGSEKIKTSLTTPGPIEFNAIVRSLVESGATDVVCEVSAHAGALKRTSDVRFETVTYMNLSRDHGDHFPNAEYLDAKLEIARDAVLINPDVFGIGNARDPHTQSFLQPIEQTRRFTFSSWEEGEDTSKIQSDLKAIISGRSLKGIHLTIETSGWSRVISLPLIGRFNAQNAAAAASIATVIGIDPDVISSGLENTRPNGSRIFQTR